ncbi:uncharacterized protein LOC131680602 [Topomyia yanbarensis]|uniref:uncharacterized protein LOC131680602 n=1 Tax=Topomyia yanbarensis TaxID=2498891 RepID=UPI00273C89DD|nr:uncharacterized protein LOC131680602 [Topomyia yanbarensis]
MVPITLYVGRKAFNTIAFLDEGSSSTLIEEAVANKLGAKGESEPLIVSWTGDIKRYENGSHRVSLMLSAQGSKEKFRLENVHTVSRLVLPKQVVQFSEVARRYSHLAGVSVTDYGEEQPTIMIGLDNIHLFAPLESRIGRQGEPIAVRSRLGWTVYGPEKQKAAAETFLNVHIVKPATNEELHDMMREQYALDEAGVTSYEVPEPVEEQRAREILRTTTKRVGKRFQTGLLWREDERNFPDSYPMAMRRLLALERKLNRDPALDRIVREQISDYQIKGYAHKATAEELEQTPRSAVWYLPLNVVLNPRKPGKVRLVWDAAATVNGVSLNSELLKGPDMLVPLPRVICHFREKPVAFGGDIQEMYHQVRIREEDKQAQRFLFREALTDAPQVYVMDVATFGSTCSPSSAQFVKNMNAEQFAERYPEAADAIIRRHYVDDYYDSVDTVDEAIKRANEVKFIHSQGGFNIRNWVSNSTEFLEALGERTVETAVHFNRDKCTDYERVLGIVWEPVEDVFCFAVASKEEFCEVLQGKKRPTKRIVLSIVMAQFDPAGFLTPVTILGKMLVQDLWRTGCCWDDSIDDVSFKKWLRWSNILIDVQSFKLPRSYFGNARSDEVKDVQLHIFADASETAYGCVAYFRAVVRGEVVCALVMSRAKVAPIKQLSIPRLELLAAVLAARLARTVRENHNIEITKQVIWVDAATVLSWIQSVQRRYKQFVGFRIGEILSTTKLSDWRWLPTRFNLADQITKWGKDPDIRSGSPWVQGLQFMYQEEKTWPKRALPPANTVEELRVHLLLHDVIVADVIVNAERFSKWTVLVRTMACVYRFISNCRKKISGLPIEALKATDHQKSILLLVQKRHVVPTSVRIPLQQEEYLKAERSLLRMAQVGEYIDEVKILLRNRDRPVSEWLAIEKSSPLFKLTPLIEEHGLIRMEGRSERAEFLPFDLRFPVILPGNHAVTRLLVKQYHEKFGHGYRETVKNELKQHFYIPGIHAVVRKVSSACM